jgi:hypothetical protein
MKQQERRTCVPEGASSPAAGMVAALVDVLPASGSRSAASG